MRGEGKVESEDCFRCSLRNEMEYNVEGHDGDHRELQICERKKHVFKKIRKRTSHSRTHNVIWINLTSRTHFFRRNSIEVRR